MWWWLAAFVVSLLVTYAVMSMIPKPETGKPPEVEEFDGPTAIDGREITVLFGTRDFPDLQVHWWGDVRTGPRKDADTGDIVVGYHYYVGMHLIACLGPVDFLSFIWVDERPLAYSPTGEVAGGSILVDNLDLFGGPAGEGGVKGYIDVEMGLPTQGRNSYLEHNLDGGDAPGDFEAHDIPAFRGVVGLVLKGVYIGHTPYLKKWMVRLQRIHLRGDGIEQWYDEKAEIVSQVCSEEPTDSFEGSYIIFNLNICVSNYNTNLALTYSEVAIFLRYLRDDIAPNIDARIIIEISLEGAIRKAIIGYADGPGFAGINPSYVEEAITWINTRYHPNPNVDGFPYVGYWVNAVSHMSIANWDNSLNPGSNYDPDNPTVLFMITSNTVCNPVSTNAGCDFNDDGTMVRTPEEEVAYALVNQSDSIDYTPNAQFYSFSVEGGPVPNLAALNTSADDPNDVPLVRSAVLIDAFLKSTGLGILRDASGLGTPKDINPAHIIRECLTDPDWGINGDETSPDESAFAYAADYLYNENMGMSLKWTSQSDIEEFIELVKKHINAELYPDHTTGKFILKLIRDDYDVASLIVLGESDIVKVENAKRPLIGDLVNSVTVQYWDSCIGEDSSVTVQDSALIHMQGKEINTTVQYPGFTYKDIAVRVATRDLRALSSQLLSCTLYAKRTAEVLNLGSVFVMHWPDLEISGIVMRVQDIDFGDGRKNGNTIKIDAVEDVFGLPATVVVGDNDNDPGWTPPIQDAEPLAHELAVEAPYYELLQKYGETELTAKLSTNPDLGYAMAGGTRVTNSDIDAVISADDGSGYVDVGRMDLCGSVEITADVDQIEKAWSYTSGIDIDQMEIGTHAQIDDELVVIESIAQTDTITGTITVGRAVLDTSPRDHSLGARLIAWDGHNGIGTPEYNDGDAISIKIQPTTGHGTLALVYATALPIVMDSRALRPYPPADLQIDGVSYPATVSNEAPVITWAQRNKLTQTTLVDHTDASITDEDGCTYTIYVIDSSDVTQITHTEEVGISKTLDMSALTVGAYTLQIWAVLNANMSWQCAECAFDFDYVAPPSGHLYWRIDITETYSSTERVIIRAIEMRDAVGGASISTGGTATASNETTLYEIEGAFTGDHEWRAGVGVPVWAQYEFTEGVEIAELMMKASSSSLSRQYAPEDFTLSYSDNGIDFTVVLTITGEALWGTSEVREYAV